MPRARRLHGTATQPAFGHYDYATGVWTAMTVTSWDQASNVICGTVSSLSPFALLVPASTGAAGGMSGAGEIEDTDGRSHEMRFRVLERRSGAERGELRYVVRRPVRARSTALDRFEMTSLDTIGFVSDSSEADGRPGRSSSVSVAFSGSGLWNGAPGYTFDARATDTGEPARDRDRFALTIRDRSGHTVAQVDGTLATGNIQFRRLSRR